MSADILGHDININAINGGDAALASGLRYGGELTAFAEAIAKRDSAAITLSREALVSIAGPEVMVDAAAVAANFQRMVRIADAIGVALDAPVDILTEDLQETLSLRSFSSASNTKSKSWLLQKLTPLIALILKKLLQRFGDKI